MSTVDELQQEVLDHQFSSRYATRIVSWLDEGHKEIFRRVPFISEHGSVGANTVVGNKYISLPSNVGTVNSVMVYDDVNMNTPGIQIYPLSEEDFFALSTNSNQDRAKPTAYINRKSILEFPYEADAIYYIYVTYEYLPDTLVLGQTPILDEEYHHYLVDYALYRAYLSEHDITFSKHHRELFEQGILFMQGQMHRAKEDGVKQVSGHWSNMGSSLPSFRIP